MQSYGDSANELHGEAFERASREPSEGPHCFDAQTGAARAHGPSPTSESTREAFEAAR